MNGIVINILAENSILLTQIRSFDRAAAIMAVSILGGLMQPTKEYAPSRGMEYLFKRLTENAPGKEPGTVTGRQKAADDRPKNVEQIRTQEGEKIC
jgi:hypothetical protein